MYRVRRLSVSFAGSCCWIIGDWPVFCMSMRFRDAVISMAMGVAMMVMVVGVLGRVLACNACFLLKLLDAPCMD